MTSLSLSKQQRHGKRTRMRIMSDGSKHHASPSAGHGPGYQCDINAFLPLLPSSCEARATAIDELLAHHSNSASACLPLVCHR